MFLNLFFLISFSLCLVIEEQNGLIDFYKSMNGSGWKVSDGWLTGDACDGWFGIGCTEDKEHVTSILLCNNGLVGELPSSFGVFSFLQSIDFNGNQVQGELGDSFCSFSALRAVGITFNEMSGPIPSCFGNLKELRWLHLDFNKFSGPLPSSFYNLVNLEYCGFYGNELSGELGDFRSLESLQFLFFSHNKFTSIAHEHIFDGLPSLEVIGIEGNDISSSVLPSLTNLPLLKEVQISENSFGGNLSSSIQKENIENVNFLMVFDNHISGPLPSSFGDLKKLYYGDFSSNSFTGLIPEEWKNLEGNKISLEGNPFQCPIPSWANFTKATCQTKERRRRRTTALLNKMNENKKKDEEKDEQLLIEIFGMAKCPDMKSIEDVFYDLYETQPELMSLISVSVEYIGTPLESQPTGIYSMHGQTEAIAELFQICSTDQMKEEEKEEGQIRFIHCLNQNQTLIPDNIEECAQKEKLDYQTLKHCALSDGAKERLIQSVNKAKEEQAIWSPTLSLNGKQFCLWNSLPCQAKNEQELITFICDHLQSQQKPKVCTRTNMK